ncbi:MAG: hypothetical protein E7005_04930 [Alphaproteobacteria bacterium]|nr:hypothetical protein [Alphaproteobacteria bacterium]
MSDMKFSDFSEFIEFCRTADTNNWTDGDKKEFNSKVYLLMQRDTNFKEKYTKLSKYLKKQGVRDNISKERTIISIADKRNNYRKKQVAYKSQSLRTNVR